ncbi:MAG TPA: MBL fold metallo-hydrolase [Tepidisphaeraceae bacterium]
MEILLLGTAAAEGWPAPFCICDACQTARKRGGPDIRTRSGALIDDELKIDFGPDTVMQMQRCGRNLLGVKTLIFTHQHSDHFVPTELEWAKHPFTLTPGGPIELWGNSAVMDQIERTFTPEQREKLPYVYRTMKAGDHFTTAAGDEVWAMPAFHVAGACVLRIRRQGKTIFYGHDTGTLPAETVDRLSDGIALDLVLLDCTYGKIRSEHHHLDVEAVIRTAEELRKRGARAGCRLVHTYIPCSRTPTLCASCVHRLAARSIHEKTRVVATHFSHGGSMMYDELCQHFAPHNISVSYDGMVINI